MDKELYIGYIDRMPAGIKRVVKPTVAVLFLGAISLAVVFAVGQGEFANSLFEFGNVKEFRGSILAKPVPFLLIEKESQGTSLPQFQRYPLVGVNKFGIGEEAAEFDGASVLLSGTLIRRDGLRMIEVVSGSIKKNEAGAAPKLVGADNVKSLGEMTLRGEIIDSKCYLGVMNPGNTKVHRSCAVACLRGGVPALFVVEDEEGHKSELWLLSNTGESINNEILEYVAEPVEFRGRVTRSGDQLFFYVNPAAIKRL